MNTLELKKTNAVISLLGLALVAIGILCATVFQAGNQNNLIFGVVTSIVGIATIVIYLPLVFKN